jgi:hypothetical protein
LQSVAVCLTFLTETRALLGSFSQARVTIKSPDLSSRMGLGFHVSHWPLGVSPT